MLINIGESFINNTNISVRLSISIETCKCAPVVSSNFYLLSPYLSKDANNTLSGVFGKILDDAIPVSYTHLTLPTILLV